MTVHLGSKPFTFARRSVLSTIPSSLSTIHIVPVSAIHIQSTANEVGWPDKCYDFHQITQFNDSFTTWSEMENIYPESIGVSSELSEEYILRPACPTHDQTSEIGTSSDSGSMSYQSPGYYQSPTSMTYGQTGRPPREPDSALSPEELNRRNRRRARNREAACRQRDRRLGKVKRLSHAKSKRVLTDA